MIIYNQKAYGLTNLCTVFAALTMLSNQFNIKLSDVKIRELILYLGRTGQGSLPEPIYKKIAIWWNDSFPNMKVMLQTRNSMKIGNYYMIGIRWNSELYYDCTDNGVIDRVPYNRKTIGGHACCGYYDGSKYTIIDNYESVRTTIYTATSIIRSELERLKFIQQQDIINVPAYYRFAPKKILGLD